MLGVNVFFFVTLLGVIGSLLCTAIIIGRRCTEPSNELRRQVAVLTREVEELKSKKLS